MDEDSFELVNKLMSHVELSKVIAQNTELTSVHMDKIRCIWDKENDLVSKNADKMTLSKVLLDLEVLDNTGAALGHFIKIVKPQRNKFFLSEFGDKMSNKFVQNGKYDWQSASRIAAPIINRFPGFPLLLGTLKFNAPIETATAKKRKINTPRPKDEVAKLQKAEKVVTMERTDINWYKFNFITEALQRRYEDHGNRAISLYNFIIHPTDFSTTIENIFQLSFVIREGFALIEVIDDDLYISPMPEHKMNSTTRRRKNQFIFSITMKQWKEIIEEKKITQPAINWAEANQSQ